MPVKVLITGALHASVLEKFKKHSEFEIHNSPDCSRTELLAQVSGAQVLITRSETTVDREVIDKAIQLKVILRAAVGVGNIDVDYATEKGILVINCPGKNTNSAAELTVGLILAMLRNIPQAMAHLKKGGWDRHQFSGHELRGKKIGIVGLGNVGHRVALFAKGFDMEVYSYDPYIAPAMFERYQVIAVKSLQELASKVDILTLHVPLNKETKGMVSEEIIKSMSPGSYLVNVARGGLVDERLVLKYLNNKHLAAVAIDTFESEPKPLAELIKHERLWCTPHIGASTDEAQRAIGETTYEQMIKALEGGVVDYPVNLPQVGIIDHPLLKSYAILAEKLGSFASQIIDFNPHKVEIVYRGDLAEFDHTLIRLGWMKGYVSNIVDNYVSYVNAQAHFESLGLHLEEKKDPGFDSYRSALKVKLYGQQGHMLTTGGVVFDGTYMRITLVNDFYFEIEPKGNFIVIENHDRPGVIGNVGMFLANHGINIASFDLSRNRKGGKAMALIRVDTDLGDTEVKKMLPIENIINVRAVML